MTVQKLIKLLEKCPPKSRVFFPQDSYTVLKSEFDYRALKTVRVEDLHDSDNVFGRLRARNAVLLDI